MQTIELSSLTLLLSASGESSSPSHSFHPDISLNAMTMTDFQ